MDYIRAFKLDEKLPPNRNPSITWFYCFLVSLIAYFSILTNRINSKVIIHTTVQVSDRNAMSRIFPNGVRMEEIVSGHNWTEGPLIIEDEDSSSSYLIFSDTVQNKIMRFEEGKGFFTVGESLFMHGTGCSRENIRCQDLLEPGSNGLVRILSSVSPSAVNIIAAQHGNRAVTLLFENGTRIPLATHYKDKQLNSPNDLAWSDQGNLYFTDPTYGLVGNSIQRDLRDQELDFSGIFMLSREAIESAVRNRTPSQNLILLDSTSCVSPNGLAFNTRFSRLYVTDSVKSSIMVHDVSPETGLLSNGRLFFDGRPNNLTLDGIKVDTNGVLYVAGASKISILSVAGDLIASIDLEGKVISNIAIARDGWMYITAGDSVLRTKTQSKPATSGQSTLGKLNI